MEEIKKEAALAAFKKAIRHKKEASKWFEKWLKERGIEGKVVTL
jgi:peptidyl-tRNA hydrolase